ncbi:uncharacterized protein LOC141657353 [Silene latifolia]|uniref:uncharacterized protein LOC141657353 n=1 Tax=Silene latifolia TaxID=37657 RepID=UPI003D778D04
MAGRVENISSSSKNGEVTSIHKNHNHNNKTPQLDSRYIIIKFVNKEDKVLHLRMRRNSTLFGAAFEMYRKNYNLSVTPNFFYKGTRIYPSATPAELNFKGKEQMDVYTGTGIIIDDDSRYVIIKFVNQGDRVLHLRVKKTSRFGAAFEIYRKNYKLSVMPNFLYNVRRLSPTSTPAQFNFKGREQIDVFISTPPFRQVIQQRYQHSRGLLRFKETIKLNHYQFIVLFI